MTTTTDQSFMNPEAVALGDPDLSFSFAERRTLWNFIQTLILWLLAGVAAIPLISVLWMLISRGGLRLSLAIFTELPPAPFEQGGGIGNAILGTLVMVVIAAAISIPIGVLGGIYTGLLNPNGKLSALIRFVGKVLTGFPSILSGVFVYAWLVVVMKTYSALAGGVALSILMLPTILLTAEQAFRMVPQRMKDAAYGMGCNSTQVATKIVLPTALPGVMTGVMLAVAGASGESAPLLFTALFSNYWIGSFTEPTASLSILIYNFSAMPYENQIELAWTASLVLVLIVLVFNILSRSFGTRRV
ncbi:phosphate ABC transporter permease PstA [Martelella limonii]|uniref:phosphate ABC transporter permease PstA n=1 Tax=Martelella limonii TaxID=1647649 RepID=UPI0019D4FE17|nr:phosphate ABC transporter permease PstA [Martelella limonii]